MSLFPALVPQGTLLYHGDCTPEVPPNAEWLAFEIPHAEIFSRGSCIQLHSDIDRLSLLSTWALEQEEGGDDPPRRPPDLAPGWLHIYQANRPLKLLYIDGMAAAKSDFGPMDTQDLLLSNDFNRSSWQETERVQALCKEAVEWHIDGFIRMEAGFEVIKCNFSDGLDVLSTRRRPHADSPTMHGGLSLLDLIRDVSARYNGIDASRVLLDYSSMVSAYFYPTNLSNPDPTSNLPRLLSSSPAQLSRMRSDLGDLITRSDPYTSIDWQGVVDMIQKRYSERLQFMATDPPLSSFITTISALLNVFVDYDDPTRDPVEICSVHYLLPIQPSTTQDQLIFAAIVTVSHRICNTLFSVRDVLFERQQSSERQSSNATAVELVQSLMGWLDWPDWKKCGPCSIDEVCFVAVFPFGSAEDHFNPRCKNGTAIAIGNSSYWRGVTGRPRRRPDGSDTI
jgi:hypothetical protein